MSKLSKTYFMFYHGKQRRTSLSENTKPPSNWPFTNISHHFISDYYNFNIKHFKPYNILTRYGIDRRLEIMIRKLKR